MNQDLSSLKRKSRSVSSFLKKTYGMLQDIENNYAIQWSQSGVGFVVVKEQEFSKHILPKYFKHSNYSSFVRQLNMYNFHKIREANCESHFHHECFRKENKALLSQICRKPEKKKRKENSQSQEDQQIDHFDDKSNVSMKLKIRAQKNPIPSINSKLQSGDNLIKSFKQTPKKTFQNTRHHFVSEREHIPSVVEHINLLKPQKLDKFESKQRISIQNILSGSIENDDDKLSINNELAEVFPRIPTKEIFCPSNNNMFQLPLPSNIKGIASNFNILF